MSDLSLPLLDLSLTTPEWPGPPLAAFEDRHPVLPAECTIEGTSGHSIGGRLLRFAPALRSAELRLGQRSLPFAFDQVRRLSLSEPLHPRPDSAPAVAQPFRYRCASGQTQEGYSLGHVLRDAGLFLYLPHRESGAARPVSPWPTGCRCCPCCVAARNWSSHSATRRPAPPSTSWNSSPRPGSCRRWRPARTSRERCPWPTSATV